MICHSEPFESYDINGMFGMAYPKVIEIIDLLHNSMKVANKIRSVCDLILPCYRRGEKSNDKKVIGNYFNHFCIIVRM